MKLSAWLAVAMNSMKMGGDQYAEGAGMTRGEGREQVGLLGRKWLSGGVGMSAEGLVESTEGDFE